MEHSKLHSKKRKHKAKSNSRSHWTQTRSIAKYETGIVYTVSIQGSNVYMVVRKQGRKLKDVDGNIVYVDQGLYGNRYNVPEDKLTMTEVLLPTNIDTRWTFMDYSKLVGSTVKVEIYDDIPRLVHVQPGGASEARVAPRDIISRARATNDDMVLSNPDAYNMLAAFGIPKNLVDMISKEKLVGGTVSYGAAIAPDKISQDDISTGADLSESQESGIVTGIPEAKLKEKPCHKHPVILGGL